ncbi:N-acetylgalactosamine-6-sulfatase [Alteromonas aestuariivivens]|uniref:N-acetylgalactosamine-6-sulfatase n=1 Tax=Alteromonas aestuariivivens TaxID=1938339 RepID=A0A3D8MBA2_9ALTE|nr:arylsulfatase [Alteromonas aestuariivivens]RDV27375.1 N-acetylgalactosamine-6-sulfatase [Alteromonas aestuariivivens]
MFRKKTSNLGLCIVSAVCSAILAGCSSSLDAAEQTAPIEQDKPNVIYIIVDDMGIGDIEPYGQDKIRTPNLQQFANEGLTFTQHYAGSTVCSPSRAALMTGLHTGHNQIRGNYELGDYTDDKEYGQMPLNPGSTTLATVMKQAGYTTALIGKWGLGGPGSYGVPNRHGFDYFFGYLDQKQAHNHYPTHLWRNEQWVALDNEWVHPHQPFPEGLDPYDPESYKAFLREDFAQERLTQDALRYIKENHNRPFFLYLAYAGPHAALQAPEAEIDAYNFEETPYGPGALYLPQRRPRAARAAMISHIDKSVGQITRLLEELNLDDNTLVIFTSDNGPSFEGGADLEFFDSNGEFRGYKRDLYEGGIRMPTIARWPGKVAEGQRTDHVSAFWDVLPTLADLAGVELTTPTDGISFLPTLLNEEGQEQHSSLYWEFHNMKGYHIQAVRMDDDNKAAWKAVRIYKNRQRVDPPIELYNLTTDPSETHNVAENYPEVVEKAAQLMKSSRTPSFMDAWNFDYRPDNNH